MPTTPKATLRTWAGLLVLLLPALLTSMDISVLFVAAPVIAETLRPSATQWLWAMDVYGFVMAGLLITMGGLGDRVGRRRLLLAGAALFGAASVALAYAPTPELLILARAALAIGGATLAPSTLSLIRGMFADEAQRRAAVGAWTVAFSGGAVAGPVVGGVLLEHFWWGSVFLINVPVMVLLLVAAPFLLAESRDPARAGFDVFGVVTSLVAILSLVYALKQVAGHGFGLVAAGAALAGAGAAAVFLARQRRAAHPLIDLSLFRVRAFSAAVGASAVVAMATVGLGVLAFTFMQTVHGLTPLQAALWAAPTFAGTFAGAGAAAALAARVSPAPLLTCGLLAAAAGFGIVATLGPGTGLWVFLAGYTVLTFGVGITATIANSLVLSTAPPERAGTASGIAETSTELGGALGIAVLGTVASAAYRTTMTGLAPAGTGQAATETVTGAVAAARETAGPAGAALLDAAHTAYTAGVTTAALIGALLTAAVAVLTAVTLRARRPLP
ncbi:MFS transporter [Microtetraspora sp. NBRC 13810]|uniref:MFS transporter n=1 Tax=Microtetraspora sp. NBRC 13810 TaxID=3030990 RepID=UPI002553C1AF|nr:MFS transporter [Microtetraspora sp. NBRC 13810]